MTESLAATFRVLSKTDNKTAVRVLLPALDSPHTAIQEGALVALLSRYEPAGQREILSRISNLPHHWRSLIRQHADRMAGMLRSAIMDADESLCMNACRAALMFDDYEVIPALLVALENGSRDKADMAAETLLQLAVQLFGELEQPCETDYRDLQWCRRHVLASLESSVQRYGRHKRREAMEAFLLLADRGNKVMNQILHNPHHLGFLLIIDVLSKSELPGIMRLLLSFLDDPRAPSAVLSVMANRSDPKFVRQFLRHVGLEPTATIRQNLKRIGHLAWIGGKGGMLDYLDNPAQCGVVRLIMASGIPRTQAFGTIKHLLTYGKPAGRREAALALAAFNGGDANALALKALEDSDPQVVANMLAHIRQRAIPGILPRLMKFIDSPHLMVRRAVQQSLAEFSFQRFLGSYETLDEEVQQTTGALVMKIDPQTLPLLREELLSSARARRIKAMRIARAMDAADYVEPIILELLHCDDPEVRAEAVLTLGTCKSPASREAAESAVEDSSPNVQKAAWQVIRERPGSAVGI